MVGKTMPVRPVGKHVSEGDVKRTDDGLSVVGGTQLGNDNGLMTVHPS